jgi:hypothetical protein
MRNRRSSNLLDTARLAREHKIAFVLTDFDGPLQRTIECLVCRSIWRIFLDRFGQWPPDWQHCPHTENHPSKGGDSLP